MKNPGNKLMPGEVSWILEDRIRNGPYTEKTEVSAETMSGVLKAMPEEDPSVKKSTPWPWPTAATHGSKK